jgi:hypothetical protein
MRSIIQIYCSLQDINKCYANTLQLRPNEVSLHLNVKKSVQKKKAKDDEKVEPKF